MAEVMKHPTASELDDYAEYKRLRRIHRDEHKKGGPDKTDVPIPGRGAPPIPAGGALASQLRAVAPKPCPSPSRTATSREPASLSPGPGPLLASPTKLSIGSTSLPHVLTPDLTQSALERLKGTHGAPRALPSGSDSPVSERNRLSQASKRSPSVASERSHYSGIRDVVPWLDDHDLELIAAAPSISTRPNRVQPTASTTQGAAFSKVQKIGDSHSDRSIPLERPTTPQAGRHGAKGSGDGMLRPGSMAKDGRKSLAVPFSRSRNPLAKLFDGAVEDVGRDGVGDGSPPGVFGIAQSSLASRSTSANFAEDRHRPLSPIPIRAGSPSCPLFADTDHQNSIDFVGQALPLEPQPFPDMVHSSRPEATKHPSLEVD